LAANWPTRVCLFWTAALFRRFLSMVFQQKCKKTKRRKSAAVQKRQKKAKQAITNRLHFLADTEQFRFGPEAAQVFIPWLMFVHTGRPLKPGACSRACIRLD
jgi:hypothetical protein